MSVLFLKSDNRDAMRHSISLGTNESPTHFSQPTVEETSQRTCGRWVTHSGHGWSWTARCSFE